MLKFIIILLLLPSISRAYPEILSKSCSSCHSEASGYGILTAEGKKSQSHFEITPPEWLAVGAKADLKQTFSETPYGKTASFKVTRIEAQLGLNHAVNSYLNLSVQGSLNRIEPENKSDSISDYVYSPYRFIEAKYSDLTDETAVKHGYYRNELQTELMLFETSYEQSEIIYSYLKHQASVGYINRLKAYNTSVATDDYNLSYKFFQSNRYSVLLGHQWDDNSQQTAISFVVKKNEKLTFKTLVAQTAAAGTKGIRARLTPYYQHSTLLKYYGFAEYQNANIKTAKPRTISYGLGADYSCWSQGLLSVIYSKTDDSNELNNPLQKLEFNLHFYM